MGLIYTGENDARLRELTITRAIAAMPVAGRYRVIDFVVSSMVNGGMKNIGVITQKNYHSLMDHLGSGKEWDLHGKNDGLHILPPFLTRENVGLYPGLLDALRSNNNFFIRSKQETLVLSNSNIIYNAHLDELVQYYRDTEADITLLYTTDQSMKRDEYGTYLALDDQGTRPPRTFARCLPMRRAGATSTSSARVPFLPPTSRSPSTTATGRRTRRGASWRRRSTSSIQSRRFASNRICQWTFR